MLSELYEETGLCDILKLNQYTTTFEETEVQPELCDILKMNQYTTSNQQGAINLRFV